MTDYETSLQAFLYTIRASEHTLADAKSDACYNVFYGGSRFENTADHPCVTGEKAPVRLSATMCVAAGFKSGVCYTTAAGAYQFTRPTWNRTRAVLPRLPNFSRLSQDLAAVRLLGQLGALHLLEKGDIKGALAKCASTWASLPGSLAKQRPKSLEFALARYTEGLTRRTA